MNEYDINFKRIVRKILYKNCKSDDRTGVGTIKIPSAHITIDLGNYDKRILPALSLRKVFPRVAYEELMWMLSGSCDVRVLQEKQIKIWDGNSTREFLDSQGLSHIREGFIGKGYGHQFRNFNGIDQLADVVNILRKDPQSRRALISLWNPADMKETALPPCHLMYHFVATGNSLNLNFYQRSSDFILAGSQNFMFAAFFLHMVAELTGHVVGELTHFIGDCHIYKNHIKVAEELMDRDGFDTMAEFEWGGYTNTMDIDSAIRNSKWEHVDMDYESDIAIPRERLLMAV